MKNIALMFVAALCVLIFGAAVLAVLLGIQVLGMSWLAFGASCAAWLAVCYIEE